MSSNPNFEDFLDGLLGPDDEAAIEKQVTSDPRLAREASLQGRIDRELKDMYAYDESRAPVFPAEPEVEAPAPIVFPGRNRMWRGMAIAAALLLVGIGVRVAVFSGGPVGRTVGPEKVYAKLISRGFQPEFVCTTDEEFKKATKDRLGTPLLMASASNIQLLGWAYNAGFPGKLIGDSTMLLLAKVDSKEVLVMMDQVASDRELKLPAGSGLYLHRRVVGSIVNYEISPFETAKIVDRLSVPQ